MPGTRQRGDQERRTGRGGDAPGARCEGTEVGKIEVAEATPYEPVSAPSTPRPNPEEEGTTERERRTNGAGRLWWDGWLVDGS